MLKTKTLNKTFTTIIITILTLSLILVAIPFTSALEGEKAVDRFNSSGTWQAGYDTIQAAIDAASAGDIITVDNGTYTETLDIPNTLTGLELRGTRYGVDARGRTGNESTIEPGAGTTMIMFVHAADVVIDGFNIIGNEEGGQRGVYFKQTGCTASNNKFTKIANDNIFTESETYTDITSLTILNNSLTGLGTGSENYRNGILVESYNNHDITGVIIANNTVTGFGTSTLTADLAERERKGIGLFGLNSAKVSAIVTDNTITGNSMGLALGGDLGSDGDTVIANNTISSNYYGVFVKGSDGSEYGAWGSATAAYFDIANNTISNNVQSGIYLELDSDTLDGDRKDIYYNNINGNGNFGIENKYTAIASNLNATYNWWGIDTGPSGVASGDGDDVTSNVDYDPWLGMYSKSITPTAVKGNVARFFNITVTNTGSNPSIGYINITYPSSGWTYNGYTTPSNWYRATQDGKTLVFRANPGYYLDKTESVTLGLNMTPTDSGNWTVACKNANDEEGYLPPPLEVLVDSARPTVTIPALPTYYSVGDGNKIWINGTIKDETYATPSLAINNTTYFPTNPQVLTYNASADSYTWYFRYYNTSAVPDGYLAVNITGTDAAGNDELNGEVVYATIDNTAPTLISLVVADDQIGNLTKVGNTFYMSGGATGLNFTITFSETNPWTNVTYLNNGTGTTAQTFQNNTWFYSGATAWYNVTGINLVTVYNITITDAALPNNNTLTTSTYTIVRDQVGPTVPTFTVTEICGGLIIKNLNSTDNVGVQRYDVYVNGTYFLNVTATQLANTTLDWITIPTALNRSCVFDGTLVLNLTNYAGGHANLTIRAIDIGGNIGNFSTPTVYSTPETRWYAVELQADWNLIGLPLIPASTARADVLSLILKQGAAGVRFLYGYDKATSSWTLNPTTMVDGKGYWINMKAYDVMIVSGRVSAVPPALPPSYYLTTGWEFAGYKAVSSMNCSTYLASLASGSYFAYLYVWDAPSQSWVTRTAGDDLDPGWGFWIWMYSNQTLIPPIP